MESKSHYLLRHLNRLSPMCLDIGSRHVVYIEEKMFSLLSVLQIKVMYFALCHGWLYIRTRVTQHSSRAVPLLRLRLSLAAEVVKYCRRPKCCRMDSHVDCQTVTKLGLQRLGIRRSPFLADRTNGWRYWYSVASVRLSLSLSLCLSSVTLCIVAKRCVLESRAKVTIDSLQEVVYEKSIGTKMNDLDLCFVQRSYQGHVNHCVTIDVEYLGNRQRQRFGSKGPPIGNDIWTIKWSRDR